MAHIGAFALVVPDYDDAIAFYVDKLGFDLIEDTPRSPTKRWVLVAPKGSQETRILLAKADGEEQNAAIGHQTGGRVFLFLHTENFDRDYSRFKNAGVKFNEAPRHEAYGKVVVFEDPYGNKWDLIEPQD